MTSAKETAILFFSRSLKEEFLAKNAGLKVKEFSNLYQLLVRRTTDTIRRSGIYSKSLFSDEQIGASFGERLVNGLRNLFSEGFNNVIVVGNDAPELTSEDLIWAKNRLEQGKNVLGKDSRGGAYLIGFSKQSFCKNDVLKVNWNTSLVYDQLKLILAPEELSKTVIDLNLASDFERIIWSTSSHLTKAFKYILSSIFRVYNFLVHFNFLIPKTQWFKQFELRGPPILSIL
ncbi:MAG: hypothetical protein COW03_17955 [Cytophagales bacterium CG12_big_fil_rev_8_21_14_0_65_40_12]|nr:MAG: hypothetical protein COW03_17955 [Cytophagales bacterium CG12_big_fil_rev_8_21_14_0_65_40_12]PIW06211.1 MAG: hypothetical protein COW40_00705 [Cytophagales bacterium CG17_big_fil_post_rev_8_21_14_2_50_40_13]